MKARRLTDSICVASKLLGILAMAVFAQRSPSTGKASRAKRALEPQVFSKRALAPAVPRDGAQGNAPEPIPWTVQVDWTLQLDDETGRLYEQVASAIQAVEDVPETRTRFFSAVQDPPRISIRGWGGLLHSVEPADGGYVATVAIQPRLTSTVAYITMVGYRYLERYFIDADGSVHFLESLDPLGMAGQEPFFYSSG